MPIRDQGYTRYQGDLTAGAPAWWVIAAGSFRLFWGYTRTKLLFIFTMIIPVLFLVMTFGERLLAKFLGGQGGTDSVSGMFEYAFGYVQIWMLAIMLAAAGAGVIADDMRYKTIQLYFSKPIGAIDYAVGKFLSLMMLGAMVTVLPTLLVGGVRLLVFSPSEMFMTVLGNFGFLLVFDTALLALFSGLVMALSCLTERTGYVVLGWLGTVLVPSIVATVVNLVRNGEAWPELLSIVGSLSVALKTMVGYKGMPNPGELESAGLPDYMNWAPWLVLLAIAIGAYAIVHWRTTKLEGIT